MGVLPEELQGKLRRRTTDTSEQFLGADVVAVQDVSFEPRSELTRLPILHTRTALGFEDITLPIGRWLLYHVSYCCQADGVGAETLDIRVGASTGNALDYYRRFIRLLPSPSPTQLNDETFLDIQINNEIGDRFVRIDISGTAGSFTRIQFDFLKLE